MSCNYAENLSHYENKGKLGLPEIFDSAEEVEKKCIALAELLKSSKHTVVHTGAGISTSAGIPDFRGPNGVWTLEKKGKKPSINVSWDDAKPTKTHMALLGLQKAGYVSYVITQNIDGLHLRSGLPRICMAELHGNLFVDKCGTCQRQFVRQEAAETVGLKSQGVTCPGRKTNGRRCRGKLQDTILDWEDSLPEADLDLSSMHSCSADLSLCLGTTLQIVPSGNLPVHTKKRGGKLVICNLQPTKQDKHADLIIHSFVDDILTKVLDVLQVPLPEYGKESDPVMITRSRLSALNYPLGASRKNPVPELPKEFEAIEWTIPEEWTKDKDLIQKSKSRKVIKTKRKSLSNAESPPAKKVKHDGTNDISIKLLDSETEVIQPSGLLTEGFPRSNADEINDSKRLLAEDTKPEVPLPRLIQKEPLIKTELDSKIKEVKAEECKQNCHPESTEIKEEIKSEERKPNGHPESTEIKEETKLTEQQLSQSIKISESLETKQEIKREEQDLHKTIEVLVPAVLGPEIKCQE